VRDLRRCARPVSGEREDGERGAGSARTVSGEREDGERVREA
jgi:hypothetical protein